MEGLQDLVSPQKSLSIQDTTRALREYLRKGTRVYTCRVTDAHVPFQMNTRVSYVDEPKVGAHVIRACYTWTDQEYARIIRGRTRNTRVLYADESKVRTHAHIHVRFIIRTLHTRRILHRYLRQRHTDAQGVLLQQLGHLNYRDGTT